MEATVQRPLWTRPMTGLVNKPMCRRPEDYDLIPAWIRWEFRADFLPLTTTSLRRAYAAWYEFPGKLVLEYSTAVARKRRPRILYSLWDGVNNTMWSWMDRLRCAKLGESLLREKILEYPQGVFEDEDPQAPFDPRQYPRMPSFLDAFLYEHM